MNRPTVTRKLPYQFGFILVGNSRTQSFPTTLFVYWGARKKVKASRNSNV